jgi:hypothetical protein
MCFVRVSLLVPNAMKVEETSRIQRELMAYFAAEGFVTGTTWRPPTSRA